MKAWMEHAARFGYAAKGATYILMALLAMQAATGNGSAEDTQGALKSLDGPALGEMLLLGIAFGLGSYALWKLYLTIVNPEDDHWGSRLTALMVCFTNLGFAAEAFMLALSIGGPRGEGDVTVHWSAIVMAQPSGRYAVGLAGLSVAGYGVAQLIRAMRRKVDKHLRALRMKSDTKRWVIRACKFGLAARGVVFLLVGWFLVRAARAADASEARDFGHSLNELRQQPYGRTLLFVVAFGLLGYAGYQVLRAKYQDFET
jgi:hypothetical protein